MRPSRGHAGRGGCAGIHVPVRVRSSGGGSEVNPLRAEAARHVGQSAANAERHAEKKTTIVSIVLRISAPTDLQAAGLAMEPTHAH